MAAATTIYSQESRGHMRTGWFLLLLLLGGLLVRLRLAWTTFLNPDEALHYLLSRQASILLAYRASLPTAHPPLMILFLHEWSRVGTSEFLLRLPFAVAGVLFCYLMFLWVRQIASQSAAFYSLALFLYLPSLASLSSEIRQYAFLLLFAAASLYSLERALKANSALWMVLALATLYLAVLTHYSALIFAAAVAVCGSVRLLGSGWRAKLGVIFFTGQAGAAAICLFLFHTQVSRLRESGMPSEIAHTWLRSSMFQPGKDRLPLFAWSKTVRFFRYLFSHGTIGTLGLVLFLCALALLFWMKYRYISKQEQRSLALLFMLPFLLTLGAARAGIYPYGGTRHDVILALFAIPAVGLALDCLGATLTRRLKWSTCIALAAALIIVNVSPSPTGPYIRPSNQRRGLMAAAVGFLKSLPVDSLLLTDHQGSLVLGYYLCGQSQPPEDSGEEWALARCGNDRLLFLPGEEAFNHARFPQSLDRAWRYAPATTILYIFQSGWIDDKEQDWITELRNLGGHPRNFGPNILVCPIAKSKQAQ